MSFALFVHGRDENGRAIADGRDVQEHESPCGIRQELFEEPGFYRSLVENDCMLEILGSEDEEDGGDGFPVLNWTRDQGWHDPVRGADAYPELRTILTIHEVCHRSYQVDAIWLWDLCHLLLAITTNGKHHSREQRFIDRCREVFPEGHAVWKHLA